MSLPYALDDLQQEFFLDTCTIYRQDRPLTVDANKEIDQPVYAELYTGIPFNLQATEFEAAYRAPLGQTANENMFTRDKGFFHFRQDIEGMDIIELTTVLDDGDEPNNGRFYRVVGDAEIRKNREKMNYRFVRLEGITPPPEIAP